MRRIILVFLSIMSACFGQYSWTNQSPAGVTDDIWCVTFANDTFVAVTGKGRVLTSTDGLSWNVQTLAQDVWLVAVTYGAGLWVVVGDNGSIYYSADLKTWSAAKAVTTQKLNGVAYSGKMFAAVGERGVIATSLDAQSWTLRTPGTSNYFLHGIFGTTATTGVVGGAQNVVSNFIATGGNGTVLQSPDDGATWNVPAAGVIPPITANLEVITPAVVSNNLIAVAAGSDGFIATFRLNQSRVGIGVNGPLSIFDTRSTQNLQPAVIFRGLAYGASVFVAGGEQGTIFTSPDGLKWTQRFSGDSPTTLSTSTLLSVAYAESLQRFVAVGTGGTILVSNAAPSNLINVSTRGTVTTADPLIGGFVVNGSAQKSVLIRAIGPALSQFGVAKPLSDPVLTVYDSTNKVVAANTRWGTNSNLTALVAATLARGAFPLSANSQDSALFITLPPGAYTASITSASGAAGTALVEAYAP